MQVFAVIEFDTPCMLMSELSNNAYKPGMMKACEASRCIFLSSCSCHLTGHLNTLDRLASLWLTGNKSNAIPPTQTEWQILFLAMYVNYDHLKHLATYHNQGVMMCYMISVVSLQVEICVVIWDTIIHCKSNLTPTINYGALCCGWWSSISWTDVFCCQDISPESWLSLPDFLRTKSVPWPSHSTNLNYFKILWSELKKIQKTGKPTNMKELEMFPTFQEVFR